MIFPGCTSSIACSRALQDQGALLSSNFVLKCCSRPRTGLTVTASFSLITTSAPQLLHPPARHPPPFTLTFSTCLLIPLALRTLLWFFQLRNKRIADKSCFSATACLLLSVCPSLSRHSFPAFCPCLFHPLHYRHRSHLRQYGWSTRLYHFRPPDFPCCVPPAAS
jgi:hypothetical protein